jgi:hypothetical protein
MDMAGPYIEATDLDNKWGPMESAPDSILEIIRNVQVRTVQVCDISELSLVPSTSM